MEIQILGRSTPQELVLKRDEITAGLLWVVSQCNWRVVLRCFLKPEEIYNK